MKIEFASVGSSPRTICLNPCSNGMKIECEAGANPRLEERCLNPCSNGMKIEYSYPTFAKIACKKAISSNAKSLLFRKCFCVNKSKSTLKL